LVILVLFIVAYTGVLVTECIAGERSGYPESFVPALPGFETFVLQFDPVFPMKMCLN
jgi:hypothetical protein